jgi:predicted O-methyltransferase YrrM
MKGKTKLRVLVVVLVLVLGCGLAGRSGFSQEPSSNQSTDEKVRSFLDGQRYKWRDENIREADGKVLYDLILKHNYKKALEIGTSTGHSGTWIAWALSKTGGKLITIEIDESRYKKALENFMKAGLSDYVDARLADAHELVPELAGPFDFIFVDADKEWYTNYLKLLLPKLEVGGCFTAHNVRNLEYMHGLKEFLGYVRSLPNMDTTIDTSSGSGISISYKRPEK